MFIIRHDDRKIFRFSSLDSDHARHTGLSTAGQGSFDSIILVQGTEILTHSDAVIRILDLLGGWFRLFGFIRILPRPARDWAYKAVAKGRYGLFGKMSTCPVPDPQHRDLFLH